MIAYISGKLTEKTPTDVVIETAGVGYFINISLNTYSQLPIDSEHLKLHTYLHINDDSHTLYGFFEETERQLFRLLISVSGIGTVTARTMLSSMPPDTIKHAIVNNDVKKISSIKGIGLKTAQRTVLELKDKMLKQLSDNALPKYSNSIKDEALSALEILGFSTKNSEKIITSILEKNDDIDVEELIKQSLKRL